MPKGKTESRVIATAMHQAQAMVWLSEARPSKEMPITMTLSTEDDSRSLKQNRLAFMWYKIRGTLTGHGNIHERQLCKLSYGIPILQRDSKEFLKWWMSTLSRQPYEIQLASMDYVPVTRDMGVKQMAEYLTTIDDESAAKGIVLPKPEDLYWAALMKEADRR